MIKKHVFIVLFVLFGVLFALSSCSESGTETPDSALSRRTLAYDPVVATVGDPVSISPEWTPILATPGDVTYSITPPLDEATTGLRFDTITGVISGTPLAVLEQTPYVITASAKNPGSYTGTQTATINITISLPDISTYKLSYPLAGALGVGDPVSISPEWTPILATPGDVTYSITPPLDEATTGLRFDTITGVISGTSLAVLEQTPYVITASAKNPSSYTGTQTATINITIKPSISTYKFSYPLATGALGDISGTPRWDDSTPSDLTVTYSIESIPKSPEDTPIQGLPTGLNLDTNTGSITGSFTSLTHVTAYKVIANGTGNYGGSTSAVFLDTLLLEAHTPNTEGTAIDSREKLAAMANDRTGTYHLTNHIDLGPEPTADPGSTDHYWTPLFSSDTPFTGKLHGNGYAIYNLNIEGGTGNYQGLFAALGDTTTGATVKNLGIGVGTITGGAVIGALAGSATGIQDNITSAAMNTVASDKAHITANASETILSDGGAYVGGLVGYLHAGSTLTGNSIGLSISGISSTAHNVGGLVGRSNGTIRGYTTGVVNTEAQNVGGLVGRNQGSLRGYTTGVVNGGSVTGGLVGYNKDGTVTGYATGSVTGTMYSAGLAGYNNKVITGYATASVTGTGFVGGLAGRNEGTVTGYATGAVSGSSTIGGLVGENQNGGSVIGYATGSVAGNSYTGGFVGNNGARAIGYWDQDATNQPKAASSGTLTAGMGISATRNIAYSTDSSSYTDGTNTIFDADPFKEAFDLTGPDAASKTWPKLSASSMTFEYTVDGTQKVFTLVQPTVKDVFGNSGEGDGTIEVDMPTQTALK